MRCSPPGATTPRSAGSADGEIKRQRTSPEVREVLDACDALTEETCGAFDIAFAADPRVSPRPGFGPIDPSGFVKGWAIERAAAMLERHGIANFAINAGGDVLTRGRPEPQRSWAIGIQHPIRGDAIAATVTGTDLAVATSGRYERGDHIIDPRTERCPAIAAAVCHRRRPRPRSRRRLRHCRHGPRR